MGLVPTENVPRIVPSLGRILITLLLPKLVIHRFCPSNATPYGAVPVVNCVVWLPLYQCRIATCCGFCVELVTPVGAFCAAGSAWNCPSACMCARYRDDASSPQITMAAITHLLGCNAARIVRMCCFISPSQKFLKFISSPVTESLL